MEKGTGGELNHVLPRWLIEAAFVVMVLSAICSWHDIQVWISANCPVLLAVVQNAGMLVMYYAIMMAMRPLNHSLTWLWCCVIALGVAGFVTVTLGPAFALYNFYVATLHSLAYLPLGTLLMVWHPGRLRVVGGWMILRILVMTLIPVLIYVVLGISTGSVFDLIFEVACLLIEVTYAWLLRRALIN